MSEAAEKFIALLRGKADAESLAEAERLLEENPLLAKAEIRLGGQDGAPVPMWFPALVGPDAQKWADWASKRNWRLPQAKLGPGEYPLEHVAAYCCSRPLEEAEPKLRAFCALTSRPWWMLNMVAQRALESGRPGDWAKAAIGIFGSDLEDGSAFFRAMDKACGVKDGSAPEAQAERFVASWARELGSALGQQWSKQVFGWCFTDTEDSDWESWDPCRQALLETDPKVMAWCMEGLIQAGVDPREPDEFGDRPLRRLAIAARKGARIGKAQTLAYRVLKAAGASPADVLCAADVEMMFAGLEMGSEALADWEAGGISETLGQKGAKRRPRKGI